MKKNLLKLITLSLVIISQTSCEKDEVDSQTINDEKAETLQRIGPWVETFVDGFDSGANIGTNWEKTNRTDYNSSLCSYSSSNPKIASLDSRSCLELSASKTGSNYTSGHVKSFYSFQPGNNEEYRLRAYIKFLAKSGSTYKGFGETYGAWPAFWTTNESVWPTKGEIDILEAYSFAGPTRYASNLFYGTESLKNLLGNTAEKQYTNTEGWHTYQLRWKKKSGVATVEIYLDGNRVSSYDNSVNGNLKLENFDKHNVIFNLNVGSNTGIFDNSRINLFSNTYMYVDWVKVEKRTI